MNQRNEQIAIQVSTCTILGNIALFLFKLFAGLVGHSAAMISDAVHSLSDVLSTIIVIIGVKLANKQADKEHPYGHERFECVAAILLSAMLFAVGIGIGYGGIRTILSASFVTPAIPGLLALIAALVSIVAKEAMYWYTRAASKKTGSSALMADAWHHRSDALSSIGSFVGILGARIGFPILDALACVVICLFIVKASCDVFRDAIGKMTDRACDDETVDAVRCLILAQEGVVDIHLLNTRLFGDKIYMDLEIAVDGSVTLIQSHKIAHTVHDSIKAAFPTVKHCMVHVNPLLDIEHSA